MLRSGKPLLPAVWVGTVIGAAALVAATERRFGLAAILAAGWVIGFALLILLARRADPVELRARSRENERRAEALGRAMAKASGGWDHLPSRKRRGGERNGTSPAERAGELREDR